MDSTIVKTSPFVSNSEIPLHRNPPLAPSQELAYRNKCIQLKRRLAEIEANNDATRKRILNERERVQKQRLLRAILLSQLKEIMSSKGAKLTPEQLSRLGINEVTEAVDEKLKDETMLDDSSDESEDEDIPEPSDRPTRMRRTNNSYRETIMNATQATNANNTSYSSSNLPSLAPAGSYSPAAARDTASSYHVDSTPAVSGSPAYPQHAVPYNSQYPQQSSPTQQHQSTYSERPTSSSNNEPTNGALVAPVRPEPPYNQFQAHMRPQLEADNYPAEQISARIEEEWKKLSDENRGLWNTRYQEQMTEYQQDMDAYNRARRREHR